LVEIKKAACELLSVKTSCKAHLAGTPEICSNAAEWSMKTFKSTEPDLLIDHRRA